MQTQFADYPPKRLTRKASADHYYRIATVESDGADDELKTVQVLFSSETPVERKAGEAEERAGIARKGEKYQEVLSHDPSDVDLSALNNNAPVLDEHSDKDQIGNVKRAVVSKDRVGRAILAFDGDSDLSNLRYKQHRKNNRQISVGYSRTKYLGTMVLDNGEVGHKFAWQPDEITSTARGADPRAGSYRSATQKQACLTCGDMFNPDDLDEAGDCEDCADDNEGRGYTKDRLTAVRSLAPVDNTRLFRIKRSEDDEDGMEFSHNALKGKVQEALHAHPAYKKETDSGNTYSDYYLSDLRQDGDNFSAIVVGPSPDYQLFQHHFDFDGNDVLLGEEIPVVVKTSYEPVQDGSDERKAVKVYAFKRSAENDCEDITIDFQLVRSDAKKPYGKDANYADNGMRPDGKSRYPLDTKAHVKSALAYWSKPSNQKFYTPKQKEHIWGKIKAACKKFGIEVSDDTRSVDLKNSMTRKTRTQNMPKEISALTADDLKSGNPDLLAALEKETRSKAKTEFQNEIQTQGGDAQNQTRRAENGN